MPGKLHTVPESFTLDAGDEPVIVLAASSDEPVLAEWVRELLAAKQAVAGKIVPAAAGDRVVAVLRTHSNFLPVIASTSSAGSVTDFVALPQSDLA